MAQSRSRSVRMPISSSSSMTARAPTPWSRMRMAASARLSAGKVCQTWGCISSFTRIALVLRTSGWVPAQRRTPRRRRPLLIGPGRWGPSTVGGGARERDRGAGGCDAESGHDGFRPGRAHLDGAVGGRVHRHRPAGARRRRAGADDRGAVPDRGRSFGRGGAPPGRPGRRDRPVRRGPRRGAGAGARARNRRRPLRGAGRRDDRAGPDRAHPRARVSGRERPLEDADVVLRDGSTVHVRATRPADRDALERFLVGLSDESRVFRFFSAIKDLAWAAQRFVEVDHHAHHSLVALRGDDEQIVGHGYYALEEPGQAEVALAVADSVQGMGLGTILLGHLAAAAAAEGISTFTAEVMPDNYRMLNVFRESGFPVSVRSSYGTMHVTFPTQLGEEARERFERREQISAVAAMKRFFEPRSIAVIGASRRRGTIGGEVFHNLLESGFPGPVYPVSPHPTVQSVRAYPDVRDVPGPLDLAVIAVPARAVVDTARACAEAGAGALVVISSGFAEASPQGRVMQAELLDVCRRSGMRLIGPNCMGILSTSPVCSLNATFAPGVPPGGRIGFMSQSGALGLAVIDHARRVGLGLSSFVSVGNKADISGNDLLEYWESDPMTDLILLYLESFGNPRRFSRVARRVGRSKPILAVKSGRTAAGVRATSSHTGALLGASDATVDALFAQAGVIRADTLGELFDVASLLASQPAPAGRRVGIVTNAGGLGIMCADACVGDGLEVPELSAGTRAGLGAFLPAEASTANPIDMIASASPADYERTIRAVAASGEVDALIVIFIPPLATLPEEVAAAIGRAADGALPVLGVFVGGGLHRAGSRVPVFAYPEDAARAL